MAWTRRKIIITSVLAFLAVLLGIGTVFALMFLRFFLPRTIYEPSTIFRIGFLSDYELGLNTKFQEQYRIWVVRNTERLFVIYARCTHLGCTPDWQLRESKFKCPCHGSGFRPTGINFEGPAPRPLERYAISIASDGQVEVDKSRIFQEEMGQWRDTSCFIPV